MQTVRSASFGGLSVVAPMLSWGDSLQGLTDIEVVMMEEFSSIRSMASFRHQGRHQGHPIFVTPSLVDLDS